MKSLEQQLRESVELVGCIVPKAKLPSEETLHQVHAQLARVVRERVKIWRSVG
jgi:hypothetical protein